jgi:uncharacterized cupin superfamily protein
MLFRKKIIFFLKSIIPSALFFVFVLFKNQPIYFLMKRNFLKPALAALLLTGLYQAGNAQGHYGIAPKFPDPNPPAAPNPPTNNWHKDYMGVRLIATAPAAILGDKIYSIANDGSGATTEWGGAITHVYQDVPVVMMYDSLGANPATNAAQINGKWALVYRGGSVEFGTKARVAQNAGAQGVIIVNNVAGAPVGMAAGSQGASVTIPVLMITKADGNAMNQQLTSGVPVTVTITPWGIAATNDLGFVTKGLATWHATGIPYKQLSSNNPAPYKGLTGAFIANFGTADQTDIQVTATTTFSPSLTPTSTQVATDTVRYSSFPAADSIHYIYTDNTYDINPTGTGTYQVTYKLSGATHDDNLGDNEMSYSFTATDSIFTKGTYDFANGKILSGMARRITDGGGNAIEFSWGDLFYVAKGNYLTSKVQFAMAPSDVNIEELSSLNTVTVLILKWTDGTITADSFMQMGELSVVGIGSHDFTTADSTFATITVDNITNAETTGPMRLEANSWYWVVVGVPAGAFMACDAATNYYPRSFVSQKKTPAYKEFPIGLTNLAPFDLFNIAPGDTREVGMLYGDIYEPIDSTRFSMQSQGTIPAIAWHITRDTVPVSVPSVKKSDINLHVYPNPATDHITVDISLVTPASRVTFTIVDAMGRLISRDIKNNVQKGVYFLNTNSIPSGNYYLITNYDNKNVARSFTIVR